MSDGISSPGISRQGPDDAALGLTLPAEIAAQIVEHALRGYPAEVCGLVAGRDGVATAAYSGRNISPTPAVTYELDHDTLARIIEFEDAGLELVAIYHSHPRGPATLSPTDIARACYPDSVYLVISLATPERPELMGYRIGLTAAEQVEVKLSFPAMPDVAAKAVEAPKAVAQAVTAAAGTTQKDGSGPDNAFTPAGEWKTLGAKEGHWYVINVPGADADGYMPQVKVELKAIPPDSANFCIWTPEGLRIWKTGAQDETTRPVGCSSAHALSAQEVAQKSLWSGKFNIGGSYYICVRQTGPNPSTYKLDVTVK